MDTWFGEALDTYCVCMCLECDLVTNKGRWESNLFSTAFSQVISGSSHQDEKHSNLMDPIHLEQICDFPRYLKPDFVTFCHSIIVELGNWNFSCLYGELSILENNWERTDWLYIEISIAFGSWGQDVTKTRIPSCPLIRRYCSEFSFVLCGKMRFISASHEKRSSSSLWTKTHKPSWDAKSHFINIISSSPTRIHFNFTLFSSSTLDADSSGGGSFNQFELSTLIPPSKKRVQKKTRHR